MKATTSVALFLFLFLQCSLIILAKTCSKCTAAPPEDCIVGGIPPNDGGPPCSCISLAPLAGCVLKPCDKQGQVDLCDSTDGTGGVDQLLLAFSHKCTGAKDKCECCQSYPKDCNEANMNKPPAWGGEACSCDGLYMPPGCVLKPCKSDRDAFCVCNNDIKSLACFASRCPGNANSEIVGDGTCEEDDGGEDDGSCQAPINISINININVISDCNGKCNSTKVTLS